MRNFDNLMVKVARTKKILTGWLKIQKVIICSTGKKSYITKFLKNKDKSMLLIITFGKRLLCAKFTDGKNNYNYINTNRRVNQFNPFPEGFSEFLKEI